mgnify:CR=1 FL=1
MELKYKDNYYDVDLDITEAQSQTLEQEGIPFSLDFLSITFAGEGGQLLDIISEETYYALKSAALEALIDDTF